MIDDERAAQRTTQAARGDSEHDIGVLRRQQRGFPCGPRHHPANLQRRAAERSAKGRAGSAEPARRDRDHVYGLRQDIVAVWRCRGCHHAQIVAESEVADPGERAERVPLRVRLGISGDKNEDPHGS